MNDWPTPRTLYTGNGVGGPGNSVQMVSRFPAGLIIVDRAEGRVWVYDFEPTLSTTLGVFRAREPEGRQEDVDRRWSAALGPDYDVISAGAVSQQ